MKRESSEKTVTELSSMIKNAEKSRDGSDKKSFQLIFWLFVAKIVLILLLVVLAIWLIQTVRHAESGRAGVTFSKVTGAGYTRTGQLVVTSSKGAAVREQGKWRKEKTLPENGNVLPVAGGYFHLDSSGKAEWLKADGSPVRRQIPSPGSAHMLWAVAYYPRTLYALGDQTVSILPQNGKKWTARKLSGIAGRPRMIAADPKHEGVFAIATTKGVYITNDGGRSFQAFLSARSVSAVSFGFDRQIRLLAAVDGSETMLYNVVPEHHKTINLEIDTVERDRIVRIAENPRHPREASVVTAGGDIYLTENNGQNWIVIGKDGRGLSQK
jgi:hypothetical protein